MGDISTLLDGESVNIADVARQLQPKHLPTCSLTVEVKDLDQLSRILGTH
ncbi:MAG: hypothetical protein MZV70_21670 [Desulfobacterales bacterium]|nr:hypothetical protein [Desulfobacterales bacterium]